MVPSQSGPAVAALLLSALVADLSAQTYHLNYRYRDGYIVAVAGDTNHDGYTDILVGHPEGGGGFGEVKLVSGRTMNELKIWKGQNRGAGFGSALFVGDWNNDSVPDYMVGAPGDSSGRGSVTGIDGKTLQLSWQLLGAGTGTGFGEVLCLADVYPFVPDGKPEIIVASPNYGTSTVTSAGRIDIFDNVSHKKVGGFTGSGSRARYGTALASNGDLDGKPGDEVVVTAKGYYSSLSGCGGGYFEVISGGTVTVTRYNGPSRFCLGSAVLVDDVDADNQKEIVIGSGFNNRQGGATIWEWSSKNNKWQPGVNYPVGGRNFGTNIIRVPDMNNDKIDDVCISGTDNVHFFAGKSNFKLGSFNRAAIVSVAQAGDIDKDGALDILVGARQGYPAFNGEVGFWSTKTFPFTPTDNYVSAKRGGRVELSIDMGKNNGGHIYVVLGSLTGTGPTKLGPVNLPLTIDAFTIAMTGAFNVTPFVNFVGFLDKDGKSKAFWQAAPALGQFAPLFAHYAVLVITYPEIRFRDASNARHFKLVK